MTVTDTHRTTDERIEEYWSWFAVALYLLVTVDLLTTYGAAVRYGVGAEINPLMRYLLSEGVLVVTVVNVAVVVVASLAFSRVVTAVERTADRHQALLMRVVEVWLGLLLALGLAVFANNLSVVVLGESLV